MRSNSTLLNVRYPKQPITAQPFWLATFRLASELGHVDILKSAILQETTLELFRR